MKTLTEFSGFVLKDVMAKKTALLAEGKTEEEVQAAVSEQLKLDEAKVGFYKNVVDMTSSRIERVKRVVVALKASETEKVPENYIEREGHFYLVEYFPDANSRSVARGRDNGDFRGKGRGDRNSRDRGGPRGDRGNDRGGDRSRPESAPRAPRAEGTGAVFVTTGVSDPNRVARPPRQPRPERAPRPAAEKREQKPRAPRAPRGPRGVGELRLVLKGQTSTTLQGSGQNLPTPSVESAPTTSEQPSA
jgi:hypothetical protein